MHIYFLRTTAVLTIIRISSPPHPPTRGKFHPGLKLILPYNLVLTKSRIKRLSKFCETPDISRDIQHPSFIKGR